MNPGKQQVQSYINNFRRRISRYLKNGIGLQCTVYPSSAGGVLLVFQFGLASENDDEYKPVSSTLGSALSQIEQHAFGGNLEGFTFGGTNLIMEGDKIILIKDQSDSEWSDKAAKKDVAKVVPGNYRGQP